jgi:hypothetical protein
MAGVIYQYLPANMEKNGTHSTLRTKIDIIRAGSCGHISRSLFLPIKHNINIYAEVAFTHSTQRSPVNPLQRASILPIFWDLNDQTDPTPNGMLNTIPCLLLPSTKSSSTAKYPGPASRR